jgi:hypothetical protein
MVLVREIGWGSYGEFEGPFFRGRPEDRFVLSELPDHSEKILAVITATESSNFSAINMYDGQVLSTGLTQVTERMFFTCSQVLGFAIEREPSLMEVLQPVMERTGTYFAKEKRGLWKFHFKKEQRAVLPGDEQETLMLGCSGKKDAWISSSLQDYAKEWAAAIATFWGVPAAQTAQIAFITPRLRSYAFKESAVLVAEAEKVGTSQAHAFIATYLSFAVNNPVRANKYLLIALQNTKSEKWSEGWLTEVVKELTFGPKIPLYLHRYEAIRPVVESLYAVDLPDTPKDLGDWRVWGPNAPFADLFQVQRALSDLRYDLGPNVVDGVYGKKTKAAVRAFEEKMGLPADGELDRATAHVLRKEWDAYRGC